MTASDINEKKKKNQKQQEIQRDARTKKITILPLGFKVSAGQLYKEATIPPQQNVKKMVQYLIMLCYISYV